MSTGNAVNSASRPVTTTPSKSRFQLVAGVDDSGGSFEAARFAATVAGHHKDANVTVAFVEKSTMVGTVSAEAAIAVRDMWDTIGSYEQRR